MAINDGDAYHAGMTVETEDGPENLVLRYLRRIGEKLDRLDGRVQELTMRVGILEQRVAGLHTQYASL